MVREILSFSSTYDIGDCSFNSAVGVFVVILYGAVYKNPTSLIGSFIVKKKKKKEDQKQNTRCLWDSFFLWRFMMTLLLFTVLFWMPHYCAV